MDNDFAQRVVICFHFSIFEPLETAELLLSINNQWFIIQIKNKKQTLFQGGCPKSRIAPFAIVYFGKKYYLTVAKTKHYSNG